MCQFCRKGEEENLRSILSFFLNFACIYLYLCLCALMYFYNYVGVPICISVYLCFCVILFLYLERENVATISLTQIWKADTKLPASSSPPSGAPWFRVHWGEFSHLVSHFFLSVNRWSHSCSETSTLQTWSSPSSFFFSNRHQLSTSRPWRTDSLSTYIICFHFPVLFCWTYASRSRALRFTTGQNNAKFPHLGSRDA